MTADLRPRPPGRRQAPSPAEPGLGPHPILDDLLSREPDDSHVREIFGLGHRELVKPLEPDVVHDPQVRVITRARVLSATPTGSLMLDMGPGYSVDVRVAAGGQ